MKLYVRNVSQVIRIKTQNSTDIDNYSMTNPHNFWGDIDFNRYDIAFCNSLW